MRFAFIDTEKARMSLSRLCAFAGVSVSGYHAWKRRCPSRRQFDDMIMLLSTAHQAALRSATIGSIVDVLRGLKCRPRSNIV